MHHRMRLSAPLAILPVMFGLWALFGCAATPTSRLTPVATSFNGSLPAATALPTPSPSAPQSATAGATPAATLAPLPAGITPSGTPTPTGTPGLLTVGLDRDNTSIQVQKGQRFVLTLGIDYDWTVTVQDTSVVSRVESIAVGQGSQGVYDARQTGQTTINAMGDPVCLKYQPQCLAPSRTFKLEVMVQ